MYHWRGNNHVLSLVVMTYLSKNGEYRGLVQATRLPRPWRSLRETFEHCSWNYEQWSKSIPNGESRLQRGSWVEKRCMTLPQLSCQGALRYWLLFSFTGTGKLSPVNQRAEHCNDSLILHQVQLHGVKHSILAQYEDRMSSRHSVRPECLSSSGHLQPRSGMQEKDTSRTTE